MTNETQVRSYPRWLTTAVVVGCGLPALLMILGLDLGTPGSDAASASVPSIGISTSLKM